MTEKQKQLMLSKINKPPTKKRTTKAAVVEEQKAEETDKREESIISKMHSVFNQETESHSANDDIDEKDKPTEDNTSEMLLEENIDEIQASLDSMPPPLTEFNQIEQTLNLTVPDSLHSEGDDLESVTVDAVTEEKIESTDIVAPDATANPGATVIKHVKIRVVDDNHVNFVTNITRTQTELKEERKLEAKKKKELDLDSLEENLRLMHPEENEQGID